MKKLLAPALFLTSISVCAQNSLTVNLDFNKVSVISPYIYGYNQDHESVNSADNWTIRRLGGNRLTAFNWENGASNAGSDYINSSDNRVPNLVGVPSADKDLPGEAYRLFHQNSINAGVQSIITFPILGWVAADKSGVVPSGPPSSRWNQLVLQKGSAFSLTPDLNDGKVYLDEGYNFLIQKFGNASSPNGIKFIALDNEPSLWDNTHSLIQPTAATILDYVGKVIAAAKVVKTMDPNVKIILGEFAGIDIYDFSNPTSWNAVKKGYDWVPSFILDTLKKESVIFGQPLVDYISFHFYPQQKIDANGNFNSSGTLVRSSKLTSDYIREGRMDLPRSLYDTNYIEPSWITGTYLGGKSNKIYHRLQKSIDTYFPGVQIMIGEYDFGFDADISHAIAMVDFLGMSAQYKLGIANRWDTEPYNGSTYSNTAFKFFRNYDGADATYGTKAVHSSFNNIGDGSVWASINDDGTKLHLIIINKDVNDALNYNIQTNETGYDYQIDAAYSIESGSQNINVVPTNQFTINGSQISGTMSPLRAYHVILSRTDLTTDVKEVQKQSKISLSPNPANQNLNVQHLATGSTFQILDVCGRVVKQGIYNGTLISIEDLNKGMYLLQANEQTLKFLIE